MADPPDTTRRPRLNVRTSSWSPSHFLSANPNESDRACPPARTYAVRPPSAVPIATPGAVPNASVIGPAYYCSSSIRAAHGCSSVWAADGYPATWATDGRSSAWTTDGFVRQLDVGRGSHCTKRLRFDWNGMGHATVCNCDHGRDGERQH
jgi:hypothetical protein